MTVIVTGDIHLNDKPQDEYRWGLFNWLLENHKADELIIAGDLTDAKDRHSAKLVNRLFKVMMRLQQQYKVIILKGNHNYYEPEHPFFEFIGNHSDIRYIKEPTILTLSIGKATFIPAGVKWNFKLHEFPFVFTHATFNGAKAENGTTLTGVDPKVLDHYDGTVYSGDVHVPQSLFGEKLVYIGAPYHIRFGDEYKPRLLILYEDSDEPIHYPAPRKITCAISKLKDLDEYKINKGDQVKVRFHLNRIDYADWKYYKEEIHKIAEEKGWLLHGIEWVPIAEKKTNEVELPESIDAYGLVERYAEKHKAHKDYVQIGKELVS